MIELEVEITEKAYSRRINRATLEKIHKGIHNYIIVAKRFRDINYTAKRLADDIETNTRYLSAAIKFYYGCNFSELVNKLRVEEAKGMLSDADATMTMEEIAFSSGFANRQSFYTAFDKYCNMTPKKYRQQVLARNADEAFELIIE